MKLTAIICFLFFLAFCFTSLSLSLSLSFSLSTWLRFTYDQLAVLAPIMMALTASTPILKGRLVDTDCRWGIISESVDDRTETERGVGRKGSSENLSSEEEDKYEDEEGDDYMAGSGKRRLYKSRYDSISTYIYQGACNPTGNDDNVDCGTPDEVSEAKPMVLQKNVFLPSLTSHIRIVTNCPLPLRTVMAREGLKIEFSTSITTCLFLWTRIIT